MGKGELVVLLCLSSWYLVIVVWLFLTMPWLCLQSLSVVFLNHTQFLFLKVIIITAKIFSVIITITLHIFEPNHEYNIRLL